MSFISACFQRSLEKMTWGIGSTVETLPVINNEIIYDKMQIFISAIQKLVIKDIVKYADMKIETTKKVINN